MGAGYEALQQMKIAGVRVTGIIHVGASNGQERHEYECAGEVPVVYVEPIDAVFANLRRNIADLPGHIAVQALCSDRVGEKVRLNISSNNGESSSILALGRHSEFFPSITYIATQEMTTTTVDALLRQLDLPSQPNLLVVDTQGSELMVLKGARDTLRSIDGAYVELSEEPLYAGGCTLHEITKFLQLYGFRLRSLAINGMGHGDGFYLRTTRRPSEQPHSADWETAVEDVSIGEALSLLTPFDIDRLKERVGPQQDGGYILIPELFHRQPVLSYGIDGEYQFDIDMASRGHAIYMFDHTIAGINNPNPNLALHWIKEGVAGKPDKARLLDTLENQLDKYVPTGDDLILKMDVEGYEYDSLDATPPNVLRRFQQIVFEIHSLHSLPDPEFRSRYLRVLRKLNRDFTLFHVHANNFDGQNTYNFLSGVPVSNLLELSYVRTDLVNRRPSETLYPTELDFPNVHPHDKKLWFFPFLPTSVKREDFLDAERRMDRFAAEKSRGDQSELAIQPRDAESPTGVSSWQSIGSQTAGLINVAVGKPAKQSSTSQWSHPGEADDAVSGYFPSDCAFHTEIEDDPWWQVDLESVFPLEAIIIHNRTMTEFQNRARTLKIEVAEHQDEWTLVHAGFARFGGARNGYPFEAWLGSELHARYIRLSLAERQYLHLAQVEVFVRPEMVEFSSYCHRYGLSPFLGCRADTSQYGLERNNRAISLKVVGLKINYSGRFGNLLHQYMNAIKLAERTALKYIQLGHHELLNVTEPFSLKGITFLPRDHSLPIDGTFISGEFFNSDCFAPVLTRFLKFSPEDEVENTAIYQNYIRSHMLRGIPLPHEEHPADELTVHIRSGDIFSGDAPVTFGYRQPPLSFYVLVINHMRKSGRINKVRLVFEDRGNPCIDALEEWLQRQGIPYRVNCGSLQEDLSALIDAPHLVFGHGTFGYAVCRLSKRVETVHFFTPELGGNFQYIPSIHQVFEVSDAAGKYIRAFEYGVPFGPEEGWRNTPEMRNRMLAYPYDSLRIRELPPIRVNDRLRRALAFATGALRRSCGG